MNTLTERGTIDLELLQLATREWRQKNFDADKRDAMHQLAGVFEEGGELAHAVLKLSQGIRGDEHQHLEEATDAVGDIIIFLCGLCDALGIHMSAAVQQAWREVEERDWRKDPILGDPS